MSSESDLIDYFKLNAVYNADTNSTREVTQTPDRTQFQRQVTVVKEWRRSTKRLGHGAFSIVWLEQNHKEGELRAVKEISKATPSNPLKIDYRRELLALGRLSKHLDIFVHFHGWFESDDSVFLAMEYFELGDLEKYITPRLNEEDAKMIGRQLFEGLEILHGYNWAHRDLKPGNIFVVRHAPQWWIKIGDFGFSRRLLSKQSRMLSRVGTGDYMAPEMIWGNYDCMDTDVDDDMDDEETLPFTVAVDIWSLGCVLFRLLTRKLPFVSPSSLRRYYMSKASFPVDALIQNNVSTDGIAILTKLMKPRPGDRMNASAALLHSWTCVREPILNIDIKHEGKKKKKKEPVLKRPFPGGHSSHTNFLIEFFEGGKGPTRPRPGFRVKVAPSAASKANDLSNQGQPTARSSRNLSDTKAIRLSPLETSDARSDISTYTSAADDCDLDQPSEISIMHQYHDQGREVSARSASTQRCMDLDLGSEVSLMPPDSMHDVSRSVSNEQISVMPRSRKPSRHYEEDDLVSNVESGVVTTSQLSPRQTSGDQYSFRSGTSKSSINNPKLIETVEEAIRRLILPELNTLKHEQTMQQNRQEFESNNRESPSASTSVGTGLSRRASKHAKRSRHIFSYSGKELVSLQMGGSVQSGRTKR